jgi:hypothetical protein
MANSDHNLGVETAIALHWWLICAKTHGLSFASRLTRFTAELNEGNNHTKISQNTSGGIRLSGERITAFFSKEIDVVLRSASST